MEMLSTAVSPRRASEYFSSTNRNKDDKDGNAGYASPKPDASGGNTPSEKKGQVKFASSDSKGSLDGASLSDGGGGAGGYASSDQADSKDGGGSGGGRKVHVRTKFSPNALGLPELEYLDASDNALESIEGIRLYSRNSLNYLELRNCGILSHQLCHLRSLPLVTLRLDDNQIDNLKHTVCVLRTVVTVEHLSLLGNPIAGNEDKGMEPGVDGTPKVRPVSCALCPVPCVPYPMSINSHPPTSLCLSVSPHKDQLRQQP